MDKQIFIENRSQYHLTCTPVKKQTVKDSAGKEKTVNKKLFTVTFNSRTVDPDTGKVAHTGYTPVTKEELKDLSENCWIFADSIKKGTLVEYDKAPKEALLDSQLLDSLTRENVSLKKQVKDLEARLLKGGKDSKPKKDKEAEKDKESGKDKSKDVEEDF